MAIDTCKLCQKKSELLRSHYIPKSAFKIILKFQATNNGKPCFVDADSQTVGHKMRQATQYLLCKDCEDKLSKYGETAVMGGCYKKASQFTLRKQLDSASPSGYSNDGKRYYLGLDVEPDINSKAYSYFALSLLWRGSVTDWGSPYNGFKGALGNVYTENFRQFLYSDASFPKNTLVLVYVDFDQPSQMQFLIPPVPEIKLGKYGNRRRIHTFAIPGISFKVLVGGNVEKFASDNFQGSKICFFEWSFADSGNFYNKIASTTQQVEPKGKLALSLAENSQDVS